MKADATLDSLEGWRLEALDWILRGQFIFWLLVWGVSTWNAVLAYQEEAQKTILVINVFATAVTIYFGVLLVMAAITFSRRVGYRWRVFIMLGVYYFLSVVLFSLSALSGDARGFLFAFVVLAAVFLDKPWSFAMPMMALLTFATMGWLHTSGMFDLAPEYRFNATDPSAWISGGVVFAALSVSVSLTISHLLHTFRQSMEQTQFALQSEQYASASLRLLGDINQLIVREHNPQHLLEQTCQFIVENGYVCAWIGLLQSDGTSLILTASAGLPVPPASLPDYAHQAIRIHARLSAPPALAIPILRPQRDFGVLVVSHENFVQKFSEAEITLLQELADDLAYALENIETETQRRAIAETAVPLLTARDESEFWIAAMQAVQVVLRADRAAIYVYDGLTDRLACPYSTGLSKGHIDEINRRFREAPGSRLFRDPQPVPIDDTESNPLAAPLRPLFQREGIRSYVVFPLFSANKLLGAFVAYRNHLLPFSHPDLEAGQTLSHLVASSLQNARLFAETRAKAAEQAALFIAAQEMSASLLNPPALLETFARQLASVLNATSVYIFSIDPTGETLKVLSEYWAESASPAERKPDLGRIYHTRDFPHVIQSMKSGKAITLQADEPNLTEAERNEYLEYGAHAKLFVPLMWQGQIVGYTEIWESRRTREFTHHEINLAQTLASHAASVIHATNLFTELEKREAYFRALIENSAEGIAILDADGSFRYVAPTEERLTGYTPQEIIGKNAFANIHPEDMPQLHQAFQAGIQKPDAVITLSYRLQHTNGEWRHYEVTGHNLLHDPFIKGVVVNYRDVTNRKRVEAALEEREAYYRTLIENAVDGIAILDQEANFRYLSPSVERILGYHAEELVGHSPFDYIHPEDQDEIMAAFMEGVSKPDVVMRVEYRFRSRNNQWLCLEAVAHSLLYAPNIEGVVVNYRDITERKQSELKIQQQADEIVQAYDATLAGWARALELRDKDTEGHTRRVTELTEKLARAMGVLEEQIVHIRRGSLLHDIGKVAVPDSILNKAGPLNNSEQEIMRQHPYHAYEMISAIPFLQPALDIPYCHHEKWDGTGYPRGLKEKEIPIVARIFSVVDVWDALTSDRPYRAAWTKETTIDYIIKNSGISFDPQVVESFVSIIFE